ncbi:MAG: gluconokinase [Deltaproteobacteria bacterium]|nr:gluconokinase [Deltaproteobacteria bacterium]
MIIIVIGVTASGKTTVGKLLAEQLGWKFYDGDDFHSPANVKKMSQGNPLSDEDRKPWLESIQAKIRGAIAGGENAVFACSALKRSYRRVLRVSSEVVFVYLHASVALVRDRLRSRTGHFMPPALLQSQFDALEAPRQALQIDAALGLNEIVQTVKNRLSL